MLAHPPAAVAIAASPVRLVQSMVVGALVEPEAGKLEGMGRLVSR